MWIYYALKSDNSLKNSLQDRIVAPKNNVIWKVVGDKQRDHSFELTSVNSYAVH